ncbi:MAG TPA: ABC transporter ATP-binding protein [Devosia sp.]|nr:ABC transporter ATP-binding protein [Devosia sp.]
MVEISIEQLTVEFAILGPRSRLLKNRVIAQATGGRIMASAHDVVRVRAIDEMTLDIREGDRVGLVGHNGSGKSTLLRALAGIYKPSRGRITVTGKVGTLLAPQMGLEQEASGMENIYLRGYLLGMSKREIDSKVDDIAEFTELGEFLQLPMRTYSQGMSARLGFAISTAMHNDILLIDEGIGAGDKSFQVKAQQRISGLIDRTPIVVLASHAEDLVKRLCNRVVQLERGKIVRDEPITDKPSEAEAVASALRDAG